MKKCKFFLIIIFLFVTCMSIEAQDDYWNLLSENGDLYFCEDYINGEEIGLSDTFTPGWLTVMVLTEEPIGVDKVELKILKINEDDTEDIIDIIPFDIQADWDYVYFQDQERVGFYEPGYYRVILQKVDCTPIVSGKVTIIEDD